MSVLNLQQAAEQTGTSKLDVWRAIQSGALSAQRTDDGGFAIDAAALFGVFESKPGPTGGDAAAASEILEPGEAAALPEAGVPNDIALAFSELQDQLRGLLASVAPAGLQHEPPEDKDERLDAIAETAATEMKPEINPLATPIATPTQAEVVGTPKRAWWRRLVG